MTGEEFFTKHFNPYCPKCQESFTQWCSTKTQKKGDFNCTAAKA